MAIHLPPQAYTRDTFIQAYEWLQSQPPSVRELASSPDTLVSLYLQYRRRGAINTNPVSSQAFKQDLKNLAQGLKQFDETEQKGPQEGADTTSAPQHPMREVTPQQLPLDAGASGPTGAPTPHGSGTAGGTGAAGGGAMNPSAPAASAGHGYSGGANTTGMQFSGAHHSGTPSAQPTQHHRVPYAQPSPHVPQPHVPPQAPLHSRSSGAIWSSPQGPHAPAGPDGTWGPTYDETDFVNLLDAKTIEVVRRVQMRLNLSNEKEALRLLIAMGFERIREMLPRG